jgi:hypothetical protein
MMSKEQKEAVDKELGFHYEVTGEARNQYIANYASVRLWRDGFSANSIRGTASTFAKSLRYLVRFCRESGENPDLIIKKRMKDIHSKAIDVQRRYERLVQSHFTKCYKNRKPRALFCSGWSCVQALKSFFYHNGAPLNMKAPRRVLVKPRLAITIDEIRKIFKIADTRERLMIKLAMHGFRPETVLEMQYGPIRKAIESKFPAVFSFSSMELKGAYLPSLAFLDKEACEIAELYMEMRKRGTDKIAGEEIDDSSCLLRAKNRKGPIKYSAYWKTFKKLFLNLDKNMTPYAFRRFFQTTAEGAGIPLNWVDYLMFHHPRSADASSYSQPSPEQLKSAWLKVEPFLRIEENYVRSEDSTKKELLQSFAKFAGVDLEETIKKRSLKSIEEMNEAEIGGLYDEFRKEFLEKRFVPSELKLEGKGNVPNQSAAEANNTNRYRYLIVKGKIELIQKLDEGFEFVRELGNDEYLIRKENSNH